MMTKNILIIMAILLITVPLCACAAEHGFREDFETLANWKPLTFPKIPRHSAYSILKEDGKGILVAVADNSASGLIYTKSFNIYQTPIIRWKWKVSNIFQAGDAKKKTGDDYPLRIYVVFKYDPQKASLFEKAQYNTAKLIYGEYPPHSSLNYIWANKKHSERILPNTYTAKAQMILLQKGPERAGQWVEEQVNALDDYRKAFGANPPAQASLAIMADADNTGEKATGNVEYIEVSAK
jgi:predicted small secreted protein